jgi:putative tricarboxylic transport membrane protein
MADILNLAGQLGSASVLWALLCGTLFGFAAGLIPGIGGRVGLILAIPIAMSFPSMAGAVFLVAMHAVVHTSGSIPSIAYGLPTSAADAATVQDGYPLARQGKAGLALGASLSASAIGGVLGAIAFLIAIPLARPLVTAFGPPELLLLGLIGMTLVAVLSRQGLLQGLIGAALGMLLATSGLEPFSGTPRFTFGFLELWDGIAVAAIVGGLFVVPEVLEDDGEGERKSLALSILTGFRPMIDGMIAAFHHWRVVLISSLYGIGIGITPGVGASVACWLAYAQTARSVPSEVPYGEGALAGVIAPEAANNSKEGGAMIPTVFFGIPGSSSMAIMLGAFTLIGVRPGVEMLSKDATLAYLLGLSVIVANLLAVPFFLIATPWLVRFSSLNRRAIMPLAVAASLAAALVTQPSWITIVQFAIASAIGVAFRRAGWPRAPILLGFVIGPLIEVSLGKTVAIWGWSAFERWPFLALALMTAFFVWRASSQLRWWPKRVARGDSMLLAGILIVLFALAGLSAIEFRAWSRLLPMILAVSGVILCALIWLMARRSAEGGSETMLPNRLLSVAAYLGAVPLIGIVPASAFLVLLFGRLPPKLTWTAIIVSIAFLVAAQVAVIAYVHGFDSQPVFAGALFNNWLRY